MGEDDYNYDDHSLSGDEEDAPIPNLATFNGMTNYLITTKERQVDHAVASHTRREALACGNLTSEVGREVLALKDMIVTLCTT